MIWDWTIAGWVVALLSMLFNAFQWITSHYQSEKTITAADRRAEANRIGAQLDERMNRVYNYFADNDLESNELRLPLGDINAFKALVSAELEQEFDTLIEHFTRLHRVMTDARTRAQAFGNEFPLQQDQALAARNECGTAAHNIAAWINRNFRRTRAAEVR